MTAETRVPSRPTTSPLPALLAYCGALPLVGLAAAVAFGRIGPLPRATALPALIGYGAVTLAFLGGIRWGLAMRVSVTRGQAFFIAATVLPALIAWGATQAAPAAGLAILAAGFAGQGAWDVWSAEAGVGPVWYGRLRLRLTAVATLALVVALLGLRF